MKPDFLARLLRTPAPMRLRAYPAGGSARSSLPASALRQVLLSADGGPGDALDLQGPNRRVPAEAVPAKPGPARRGGFRVRSRAPPWGRGSNKVGHHARHGHQPHHHQHPAQRPPGEPQVNERVVNTILDDLVAACRPRRMTVIGQFSPRGGITSRITANYEATSGSWA